MSKTPNLFKAPHQTQNQQPDQRRNDPWDCFENPTEFRSEMSREIPSSVASLPDLPNNNAPTAESSQIIKSSTDAAEISSQLKWTAPSEAAAAVENSKGVSRGNFLNNSARRTSNWIMGKVDKWRNKKENKKLKNKAEWKYAEASSENDSPDTNQANLTKIGDDIKKPEHPADSRSESKTEVRNNEGKSLLESVDSRNMSTKDKSDKPKIEVSSNSWDQQKNSEDKVEKHSVNNKEEIMAKEKQGKTKTEVSRYYHFASTPPELAKKFQPKKITNTEIQSKQFNTSAGASKWNPGNTYEDRDYTKLVNEKWSAMMKEFSWTEAALYVDSFPKLAMDFSIVCARNKVKYIYDMSFTLAWKGHVNGKQVSGTLRMSDIMPDWEEDDWEWNVTVEQNDAAHRTAKAVVESSRDRINANLHQLIENFRKKGG